MHDAAMVRSFESHGRAHLTARPLHAQRRDDVIGQGAQAVPTGHGRQRRSGFGQQVVADKTLAMDECLEMMDRIWDLGG